MNAFASTQGAAGERAMADLDTAVNELQGQLFTAVLGTEDMHDAMETVVTVVKAATLVVEALLWPLSVFTTGIRTLADNSSDAEVYQKKLAIAERDNAKATDIASTALVNLNQKYKDVEATLIKLLGTKKESALFDLDNTTAELTSVLRAAEAAEFKVLKAKGDLAADVAELEARENAADSGEGGGSEMLDVNIDAVRDAARQKAVARAAAEMKGDDERKNRLILGLQEVEKRRQDILSGRVIIPEDDSPKTGNGTPAKPTETDAEREARELQAINDLRLANTKSEQQLEMDRLKFDAEQRDIEFEKKKEALQRVTDFAQQMEDEAAAERKAKGILTAEEEDTLYRERKAKALAYVQDLAGQEIGIYAQNAAKQLVIGRLSAKAASDMARTALANIIIGEGDKALIQSGIMAAELNPLAIPMFAAACQPMLSVTR